MAAAQPAQLVTCILGHCEAFDPNGELTFREWVERFQSWADSNQIAREPTTPNGLFYPQPNRRRHLFLNYVGTRGWAILSRTYPPPNDNPLNYCIPILANTLAQTFQPAGLTEANRYVFNQRNQQAGESVLEFINTLQHLAINCEFGNAYDQTLTSRLIGGIRHNDTRLKLLSAHVPNFEAAKTIALQDDTLRAQMRTLAQAHAQSQARVNAVSSKPKSNGKAPPKTQPAPAPNPAPKTPKSQPGSSTGAVPKTFGPCFRCDRRHDSRTCPAINWQCFNCKTTGHIAKKCKKEKRDNQQHINHVSNMPTGTVDEEVDHLLDFDD